MNSRENRPVSARGPADWARTGPAGRNVRAVGWGLVILGVVAIAIIVMVGAFRAHTDTEFNRWTGWATIWAVPFAALLRG